MPCTWLSKLHCILETYGKFILHKIWLLVRTWACDDVYAWSTYCTTTEAQSV